MPQLYEYDTIEDNLILAKELGLDFIELNLNFAYCRREMQEGKVAELLIKYNLEATLHFYDEADFASYDEVVEAYLGLLEQYAQLGKGYIKNINVHNIVGPIVTISGIKNYIYEKEYKEYIQRFVHNLECADEICKKNDIQLVIENTSIAEYMRNTYKDLYNKGFKFTFDIGHDDNDKDMLYHIIEETPLEFREFHIHDGNRKTCHLTLGEGSIDIAKFKRMAMKHNAYVVLEVKQKSDLIKSVPYFKSLEV